MKKTSSMISLFVLLTYSFLVMNADSAGAESIYSAFSISKDKNDNVVHYDVKVKDDCTFADGNPLDIYWLIPHDNGQLSHEDLNFIEKSYYRFVIKEKTPTALAGQVRAIQNKQKDIPIRITISKNTSKKNSKCRVQAYGGGTLLPEEVKLSSIRLENFNGQIPHQVAVIGKKIKDNKAVKYQIALQP